MKLLEKLKEKNNLMQNNKNKVKSNKENKSFKIEKNMIIKLILLAIVSITIAVVFEVFFYENILRGWQDTVGYSYSYIRDVDYNLPFSFIRLFMFIGIVFFVGMHFIIKPQNIYEFICDKRYIIATIFLVSVMCLGLNGSSLSRLDYYLGAENGDDLVEIFGVPRPIRSDEWGTQSLYILSQKYNDYEGISDILRGTDTDMFTLVNAPTKSLNMLGRTFQIMFLLINNLSAAFSFYWFARITLMCLVTYEIMKIITNNKKVLSLVGMILISFSSAVQWWYCLDVIIWGEVILVLLNLFLEVDKKYKKVLCGIGEVVGILSYIFVFYPAWQVTFGYIFIPIFVCILYRHFKNGNLKKIDVIDVTIICITIIVFFVILTLWIISSIDTIEASTSTVYPGERIATGGDETSLFAYFYNMFLPFESFKTNITNNHYFDYRFEEYTNQCQSATMLSLYPIPMILAFVYVLRNKDKNGKRDLFLIVSLVISVVLSVFCIFGFPEILSKVTLLYLSIGIRAAVPLACLNIYMFIYIVAKVIDNKDIKIIENKIIPYLITLVFFLICLIGDGNNYLQIWEIVLSSILFIIMFYLSFKIKNKICLKILLVLMCAVTLVGGLTVNPIIQSVDVIENNDGLSKTLQKYAKEDEDALWIENNMSFVVSNYMVANGVKTLSSTNIYPNIELYTTLFGDNEDAEKIWKRYHHLEIELTEKDTSLELISYDYIKLNLNYKDLNLVGVDYILTTENFEIERSYMNVQLIEIVDGTYAIYKVLEQDAIGHMDEKIESYRESLPNAVWLVDEIYGDELKELIYDNDIFPIISEIKEGFTNEILEEFNIRYILTKKNLCIERPDLNVRERQVIGEFIIYEVVNVEG